MLGKCTGENCFNYSSKYDSETNWYDGWCCATYVYIEEGDDCGFNE